MPAVDVKQLDLTQTNIAVQRLIEVTANPRHRYLLQANDRHRNLEHAGRYEEIFAAEFVEAGIEADADAMYLLRGRVAMVWPYNDPGVADGRERLGVRPLRA